MNSELHAFQGLVDIVQQLRSPEGCPWDREQTHASLKRNLLEECYEASGSLWAWMQAAPPACQRSWAISWSRWCFFPDSQGGWRVRRRGRGQRVTQKLVRRHPHVFGTATAADAREVERNSGEAEGAGGRQEKSSRGYTQRAACARQRSAHARPGRQGRVRLGRHVWGAGQGGGRDK